MRVAATLALLAAAGFGAGVWALDYSLGWDKRP
jgi:hypothetical protein